MRVDFYFDKRMVLSTQLDAVPRAQERVAIEVDGQHRTRAVKFVEWRPGEDAAIVVCDGLS